jgi:hypothetical protein
MRSRLPHQSKAFRRSIIPVIVLLCSMGTLQAQPHKKYTVKNGRMYIELEKNIPAAELSDFIHQFDLGNLALEKLIRSGFADSIHKWGWEIVKDNRHFILISKAMLSYEDINDPAKRILFTGEAESSDEEFPAVSNKVLYGFNRFRNKEPFAVKDSAVIFFLRNNLKAERVKLAGSFNDWDPEALSMTKTDSGWIAAVKLSPGKYWYKFIIDGRWMIDTDNRINENDGRGNTNSVFFLTNFVFRLQGFGSSKKVYVAGSFNNWREKELEMEKSGKGWELPLYLAKGTHTYRFIADDRWMEDPGNPGHFPNEFGEFNSYVAIGDPYLFRLNGYTDAKSVILAGSFNQWRTHELLMKKTATGWELPYVLGNGNHEYIFMVDGKVITDPGNPSPEDSSRKSVLLLNPNYTFRLKGFDDAKKVFLSGDFINWSPNALFMRRENGEWVLPVHLTPGKHLYKFIVDGKWILDPANVLWEQNEHHTGNSVLWIDKQP